MSPAAKLLIGLAATVLLGWMYHGPLGNGAHFIAGLQAGAQRAVDDAEIPGVTVSVLADPAARAATLAGPANDFQRNGQGVQKGLTQLVHDVPGIATVHWADEPGSERFVLPLLVETLILLLLGYAVGLGVAWFIWKRPRGYEND